MSWSSLINSQILSVHAALLPTGNKGRVLMLGGSEHNPDQGGTDEMPALPEDVDRAALYDIETQEVFRIPSPDTDVFCCGHAFLSNGLLVIAGGTEAWKGDNPGGPDDGGHVHVHGNFGGHVASWVYDHNQNQWSRVADLTFAEVSGLGVGGGRWYPSLLTLPSGDVIAFGGHPSRRSHHWHENDIPERYSPRANTWTRYLTAIPFEHPVLPGNWYPRLSLIRGGWLFFTSIHNGECRFFDPVADSFVGPAIAPPPQEYQVGWDYSVILLPLLPGDEYRARVMAVNGVQPSMLELNLDPAAPIPAWIDAGVRQGSAAGKLRKFSCPVYLPTGQICVTGGIDGNNDLDAIKVPEIYTPDIDWFSLTYLGGAGSWETIEEPAQVARNYHSVSLLLPDGSVFTASSSKNGDAGDPDVVGEKTIELFYPPYFDNPNRSRLLGAPPVLGYSGRDFDIETESAEQAAMIRKVVLIRGGSVTHAADFDHRYVALSFSNAPGTAIIGVTYPNDPSVLPPGSYMLWIVDQNDLPCQQAMFIRFILDE